MSEDTDRSITRRNRRYNKNKQENDNADGFVTTYANKRFKVTKGENGVGARRSRRFMRQRPQFDEEHLDELLKENREKCISKPCKNQESKARPRNILIPDFNNKPRFNPVYTAAHELDLNNVANYIKVEDPNVETLTMDLMDTNGNDLSLIVGPSDNNDVQTNVSANDLGPSNEDGAEAEPIENAINEDKDRISQVIDIIQPNDAEPTQDVTMEVDKSNERPVDMEVDKLNNAANAVVNTPFNDDNAFQPPLSDADVNDVNDIINREMAQGGTENLLDNSQDVGEANQFIITAGETELPVISVDDDMDTQIAKYSNDDVSERDSPTGSNDNTTAQSTQNAEISQPSASAILPPNDLSAVTTTRENDNVTPLIDTQPTNSIERNVSQRSQNPQQQPDKVQERVYTMKDVLNEINLKDQTSGNVSVPQQRIITEQDLKNFLPMYDNRSDIDVETHLPTANPESQFRTFMLNDDEFVNLHVLTDAPMLSSVFNGNNEYDIANVYVLYALVVNYVRKNEQTLRKESISLKVVDFLNNFMYDKIHSFFKTLYDENRNIFDSIGSFIESENLEYYDHIMDGTTPNNFLNHNVGAKYITTSYYILNGGKKIKHTKSLYSSVTQNTNVLNVHFYAAGETDVSNTSQYHIISNNQGNAILDTPKRLLVKLDNDKYVNVHAYPRIRETGLLGGNIPFVSMENNIDLNIIEGKGNMLEMKKTSAEIIRSSIKKDAKQLIREKITDSAWIIGLCSDWLKMIAKNINPTSSSLTIHTDESEFEKIIVPTQMTVNSVMHIVMGKDRYTFIHYKRSNDVKKKSGRFRKASWITFTDIVDVVIFIRKWVDVTNAPYGIHTFYTDTSDSNRVVSRLTNEEYITFISQLYVEHRLSILIDTYKFATYQIM